MMSAPASQAEYLSRMGVTVWRRRATQAAAVLPGSAQGTLEHATSPGDQTAIPAGANRFGERDEALRILATQVSRCTQCKLHETRNKTVFGTGRAGATCMVIGEAPGAAEDRQGEPFVGPAGRLLNAMLAAIGVPRQAVYIANIVKCRPPQNRDPRPDEVGACSPYLASQIELVGPRFIMAVGRVAAHLLLGTDAPVGQLRGRMHQLPHQDIPVLVTYHPAYLLRSPIQKRNSWQDLKVAKALLENAQ